MRTFSDQLQHERTRRNAGAKAEVEQVFAAELRLLPTQQRERLVNALHATSLWSFWETLRTELELSPLAASEILKSTFTALLARAGFDIEIPVS